MFIELSGDLPSINQNLPKLEDQLSYFTLSTVTLVGYKHSFNKKYRQYAGYFPVNPKTGWAKDEIVKLFFLETFSVHK